MFGLLDSFKYGCLFSSGCESGTSANTFASVNSVGKEVGNADGAEEGVLVGPAVGVLVGETLGMAVGAGDGAAVGDGEQP